MTEKLSVQDFCIRFNVTKSQVVTGTSKDHRLNYELVPTGLMAQGGAKRMMLVYVDEKVPIFLAHLKGKRKKEKAGLKCRNKMVVVNNIMGNVMAGHY